MTLDNVTGIGQILGDGDNDHASAKRYGNGIYNLQGQRVGNGTLTVADLPKGIYIINGKKVSVK